MMEVMDNAALIRRREIQHRAGEHIANADYELAIAIRLLGETSSFAWQKRVQELFQSTVALGKLIAPELYPDL